MIAIHDSTGRVARVHVEDMTVLGRLVERRILEVHHASYGLGFMELRHAFFHRLEYKSNSAILDRMDGGGKPSETAGEMYERVCRMARRDRTQIVEWACTKLFCDNNYGRFTMRVYRDAFERLVESMDATRADMQEEQRVRLEYVLSGRRA